MRIATSMLTQTLQNNIMLAHKDRFEANQQVNTGKIAPDLKGYGSDAQPIISMRGSLTVIKGYQDNNKSLDARFEIQAKAYEEITAGFNDLRKAITTKEATTLMVGVREAFQRISGALNTKFAGAYLFSGMSPDVKPVTVNSLADLQAAVPNTDAVFAHSDRRQTTKIDETTRVEINATAKEIASDVMAIIERIADFDAGANGPFKGNVTEAQQTFLSAEIANLSAAFDTMNIEAAINGSTHTRVEKTEKRQGEYATYLGIIIGDMEDVDMAKASTRLSNAQTALQLSTATFSLMNKVSLLDYL